MPRFRNYFIALFCLVCFLFPTNTADADTDSTTTETEVTNKPVTEWFAKYDQIRRDAEMTMGEKLKYGNALKKALKSGGKMSKSTHAFAERMLSKYSAAATAMQALSSVPETQELQDGYIQYFTEMERSFQDCISIQEITPTTAESRAVTKEKIEKINAKNKKLDDDLRLKYDIPKHKHS